MNIKTARADVLHSHRASDRHLQKMADAIKADQQKHEFSMSALQALVVRQSCKYDSEIVISAINKIFELEGER